MRVDVQAQLDTTAVCECTLRVFCFTVFVLTLATSCGVILCSQIPMTIIENSIKKFYLEDFYYFTQECGGETAAVMGHLLKSRADVLTINITLNSLHTDFSRVRAGCLRARACVCECVCACCGSFVVVCG